MKFTSIALLILSSAALQAASVTYHVAVDSSGIGGAVPGYIEFQFNQANAGTSLAATATVGNFTSSGFTFDNLSNFSLGGVTGTLFTPPLVLDATVGAANLFDQGVSEFGGAFGFDVTFDGPALDTPAPDGSGFFVYLLGADFSPLVLTDGLVAGIQINGDTTLTATSTDLSTINPVSAVPEPSTFAVVFGGVAFLMAARRYRRSRTV